ncbi:MAG TPA: glycosyltransferase family 4 protein [Candidatus Adamsella sp.]|nr:glycosyltransferase family 4 protein [Candidatus Adamsella sp.]
MKDFIQKLGFLLNVSSNLSTEKKYLKTLRNIVKESSKLNKTGEYGLPLFYSSELMNLILKERVQEKYQGKILLVSHEFSRTGAPMACLMLAKTIKKIFGEPPVVMGCSDGPFRQDFEDAGIKTFLIGELPFFKNDLKNFLDSFDLIIVNSVSFLFFDVINNVSVPVVWWNHEVLDMKSVKILNMDKFLLSLKEVWFVSPLLEDFLKEHFPQVQRRFFPYGIPIEQLPERQIKSSELNFLLVGSIEKRKGIHIFIDAISALPEKMREKCSFKIIGKVMEQGYYKKMLDRASGIKELDILPPVSHDELLQYYADCDVVVSSSIVDPFPIVITEGFMHSKLCLFPDAIGQALLVEDKKNAVLFKTGDAIDLKNKIEDIVLNFEKYQNIAKEGRKIYEDYFSMEKFSENVKNNVDFFVGK